MNIPCPNVIPCPGSDWPILNLSSEGFDHLTFAAPFPDPENPYAPPDVYHPVNYTDCHGVVYSNISQEIADLLALFDAISCEEDGQICTNAPQSATLTCEDGTVFVYTTPAGTFAHGYDPNTAGSLEACQAAVDAWALAYAQLQISLLLDCSDPTTSSRGCVERPNRPDQVCRDTVLNPSQNTYRVSCVRANRKYSSFTFRIVSGVLPPGVSLVQTGLMTAQLTGTPTVAGNYAWVVGALANGTGPLDIRRSDSMEVLAPGTGPCPAVVDVYAYFKLDDADSAITLVESVSAQNLALSVGATDSVPGKIAGAMNLGNGVNTRWQDGPNAHWALAGSFTVRFWFTTAGTSTNSYLLGLGVGGQWSVYYMPDFPNAMEFVVRTTGGLISVDAPVANDSNWHEFFFWFESGVGCGYRVDNGAATTFASVDPIDPQATQTLFLQNTHFWDPGVAIDEIALWTRKLTDAEMLHDWNSGNGRTYPNVP